MRYRVHRDRQGTIITNIGSYEFQLIPLQNKPAFIRFYRDYSIADFSFTTFSAILVTYSAFRSASLRASICEELSRQPELMRDLVEMGLNLENCELWFERAVLMGVAIMVVLVVVRVRTNVAYLSDLTNHI